MRITARGCLGGAHGAQELLQQAEFLDLAGGAAIWIYDCCDDGASLVNRIAV